MKAKAILTKAEISYAKELYSEHGFTTKYISKELNARPSTVARYLKANSVEIVEANPKLSQEREDILNVLKSLGQYFPDLENYNHNYLTNLFTEIKSYETASSK